MLVSIVTPVYNSIDFIEETYKSILLQSHQNWEWLVTDDVSTDGSYELLCKWADNDTRVKVSRNEHNSGAAVTRNVSLSQVNGDFIAFLDSDDIWLPDKLERQLDFMNNSCIDFSFTPYKLMDVNGNFLGRVVDTHITDECSYNDQLKKKATMGCSTVVIRNNRVEKYKMPDIRTGQDYAFWLSILKSSKPAKIYFEPMTIYRVRKNSISRNKFKKAMRQWKIYRDIEKINILSSGYYFIFYAFRAIFRK